MLLMSSGEVVYVVDDSDNLLEYKLRSELTGSERIRISAIWVENSAGDILLAQRAFDRKVDPGRWGPASAGTVVKGESYEDNAVKELAEEIGVKGVPLEPVGKRIFDSRTGSKRACQFYKVVIDWPLERFTPQLEEVASLRWYKKDELADELQKNPDKFMGSAYLWPELFGLNK
jgi:isopentenyldiphosphate isomerase